MPNFELWHSCRKWAIRTYTNTLTYIKPLYSLCVAATWKKVFSESWILQYRQFKLCTIRLRLKCDGTRAETRFRLSAKRKSPFKSAVGWIQSTTGSRGVRSRGSNAGYTMFRGSVKGTGNPLHSQVSPSLPLPWVTVCHHVSTGL